MMSLKQILTGIIIIGICAGPLYAEDSKDPNIDIKLGFERLQGTTTLSIGGAYQHSPNNMSYPDPETDGKSFHFPYSEMEMPMDIYVGAIDAGIKIGRKWELRAGAKVSVTSESDASEESYYGIPYDEGGGSMAWDGPKSQDIFSELDTELDAVIFDVKLRYEVLAYSYEDDFGKGKWTAFVGIGYLYQDYSFTLSNLDQTSPSDGIYTLIEQTGDVVTYDVSYHIPYMEVGVSEAIGKVSVEASFGFAPYIMTSDEETRGYEQDLDLGAELVSEGECDGMAFLASLDGRYNFTKHWFLGVQVDFLHLEVDGDQKKTLDGVELDEIDEELKTTQVAWGITAGFAF